MLKDDYYIVHSDQLPIEYDCGPGWYFYDEHGCVGSGPYRTKEIAIEKFKKYVQELLDNRNTGE